MSKLLLKQNDTAVLFGIIFVMTLCFVIYPSWLFPPVSDNIHIVILISIIAVIFIFSATLITINKNFSKRNQNTLLDLETDKQDKIKVLKERIRGSKIIIITFVIFGLGFLILKIGVLCSQFRIRGDEGSHVGRVLLLKNLISFEGKVPDWLLTLLIYSLIILCIATFLIFKYFKSLNAIIINIFSNKKRKITVITVVITIISIILFCLCLVIMQQTQETRFANYDGSFNPIFARYGPSNPIIGVILLLTFGYSEFGLHILSFVFTILSTIYFYKLVKIYRSSYFALTASLVIPFLPTISEYSALFYLDTGVLFFTIACTYFFNKALINPSCTILNKFLLIYVIGFLYKKVMLFILVGLFSYYLLMNLVELLSKKKAKSKEIKLWVVYLVLAIIPSVLWLVLTSKIVWREYVFSFEQIFSKDIVSYGELMPTMISYLAYIALVGIPFSLIYYRDHLTFSSLILSLSVYLIYTADAGYRIGVLRFMIPILPFITLCALQILEPIYSIAKKVNIRKTRPIIHDIVVSFICLSITIGLVTPLILIDIRNDIEAIESRLPFDETAQFLKQNLTSDYSYVVIFGPNPFRFYLEKYEITSRSFGKYDFENLTDILVFMTSNNCSFLLIPDRVYISDIIDNETFTSIFLSTELLIYEVISSTYNNNIFIMKKIV